MAFESFPRTSVQVSDGNLRVAPSPATPRVIILGVTDKTTHAVFDPVRVIGSVRPSDFDLVSGAPSELSKAIEEVRNGGADNIEVMIISNNTSISNNVRFSALSQAYELLLDHDVDEVVPVNANIDSELDSSNNFAWQLANHCANASINFGARLGFVGAEEINSGGFSLTQLSAWVTAMKAFDTTSINGDAFTIYDGVTDSGGDGVPDNFAFWQTSDDVIPTGAPPSGDGQVVKDDNNQPVDIGKYISVVAGQYRFVNGISRRVDPVNKYYDGPGAAAYAGLVARLKSESSPTNKAISGPTIIRNLSATQANDLAAKRFVVFRQGRQGVTVFNAMTGAYRISDNYKSDFDRLTTIRIINEAAERVRNACQPFIGEPSNGIGKQAMKAEIDQQLGNMISRGALISANATLVQTSAMQTLGELIVDLRLTPAFEITNITIKVALVPPTS